MRVRMVHMMFTTNKSLLDTSLLHHKNQQQLSILSNHQKCQDSFKSNCQLSSEVNHLFPLCDRRDLLKSNLFLPCHLHNGGDKGRVIKFEDESHARLEINRTHALKAPSEFIQADQEQLLEGKDYKQDFEDSSNPDIKEQIAKKTSKG
ncbi:unnamed protein product, partial [Cuscuta epithymum]